MFVGSFFGQEFFKEIAVTFLVVQWLSLSTSSAGGRVRSLVRELDPTYHNERSKIPHAATKTQCSQIIFF